MKETTGIEKYLQNHIARTTQNADAKYDLLKFLYINDTDLQEPSKCLFVSDFKTLNISREFNIFQELCKKEQTFVSDIRLENNTTILDKLGFTDEQKWIMADVKNIFQCCYEFSKRLLQEETDYFRKFNLSKVITKLQIIQKQNNPDSPVIRIGKNKGYLSLTMGLLVKDKDQSLYDNVLCHATKNTSYTGNFPKTRRIVNLGNGDVDTCGWIKLQMIT